MAPNTTDIKQLPDIGALAGTSGGIYNRIGRGIPDVSANGDNIAVIIPQTFGIACAHLEQIYNGGNFTLSGGTSASTPIFASVINRINEERINAGKGSIGFLNPSLYANPSMLNDITNGKTPRSEVLFLGSIVLLSIMVADKSLGTNPGCGTKGFSAVPGWDPVTGLGTPNFPKMLKYYLSLP